MVFLLRCCAYNLSCYFRASSSAMRSLSLSFSLSLPPFFFSFLVLILILLSMVHIYSHSMNQILSFHNHSRYTMRTSHPQKTSIPNRSQQTKVPLINLSSSQDDSASDSEKQNHCNESVHTSHTLKPSAKSPSIPSHLSHKNMNPMQFSTLSLDEASIPDFDAQIRSLISQNKQLQRDNAELRREVQRLMQQSDSFRLKEIQEEYEQKLRQCYAEVEQSKTKCRKLQQQIKRTEKHFQNKLMSQELPNKRTIAEENSRIYRELTEKVKQICSRFVQKARQQRMNSNVETLITDHVNELLALSPTSNNQVIEYLQKPVISHVSRPSKLAAGRQENLNISSDYRLLQKSIQKLKVMEREIDSKTPQCVRQQKEDSSQLYRSSALDQSSISALDKSKSKRKRIFQ